MQINIADDDVKNIASVVSLGLLKLQDVPPAVLPQVITNKAFCDDTMMKFFIRQDAQTVEKVTLTLLQELSKNNRELSKSIVVFLKRAKSSASATTKTKEDILNFVASNAKRFIKVVTTDPRFVEHFDVFLNESVQMSIFQQLSGNPEQFVRLLNALYNPSVAQSQWWGTSKLLTTPPQKILDLIDKSRLISHIIDKKNINDMLSKSIKWYYPDVVASASLLRL